MNIYVSRDYKKTLCLFVFYFTLFVGFFTFNFEMPISILYVCDAVVLLLVIILSKKSIGTIQKKPMNILFIPITILMIVGSICAVFNGFSIGRWLWSIRNWGRLFVFCLIAFAVLKKKDCDRVCQFSLKLYHVNVVIVLFQFLFLKDRYGQDALNGLFGRETSSVHITMTLIVVAIATAQYAAKQIGLNKFMRTMIEVFIVAIVAELRAIPIIVVIIVTTAYFLTFKLTIKSICKAAFFVGIIVLLVSCASYLLKIFYPDTALNYSLEGIIDAASTKGGYGYSGGIDRLTFMTVINESVFTEFWKRIFGIGIGNAEYSAIVSLCSPFYYTYGNNLSYLNFSSAVLYIETGFVGLALYFTGFMAVLSYFFNLVRKMLKDKDRKSILFYGVFGCEVVVINIFYIIYNNLQRTDVSYLLGFYLAVAFIGTQEEKRYAK